MTSTLNLEIAIKRTGITKRSIAKHLGLSEMGLRKKMCGITEFKASEIAKIHNLLKLSTFQRDEIFFSNIGD